MSPRPYVFIGANALRILSILVILLAFASNVIILVEDIESVHRGPTVFTAKDENGNTETFECDYFEGSNIPNQPAGAFWAILNQLFVILTLVVLLLSEIGWPAVLFRNFLPILGPDFGLGMLGGFQCTTAASVLSHHVQPFPLVSGWLLFVVGCLNILVGLISGSDIKIDRNLMTFREKKTKELLPSTTLQITSHPPSSFKIPQNSSVSLFGSEKRSPSPATTLGRSASFDDKHPSRAGTPAFGTGYGFGRQGEKAATLRGFMISRPVEALPRYAPNPPQQSFASPPPSDDDHNDRSRGAHPQGGRRL
ncbi:hypothetical protein FRB90_006368 [Tulasnella sp. 427]|nr:hypothetical protein FRB90_006368 [Tulasnella sp. 427]